MIQPLNKNGLLLVLSGPSGCGKGTVLERLMAEDANIHLSVSAATRAPRAGEVNGIHYHFLEKSAFEELIAAGEMLEYAKYCEHYYGTPLAEVLKRCEQGMDVVLEIEVQGAMQVKLRYPDAVMVFVMPPSMEELKRRLTERNTESPEVIAERLKMAEEEIACASRYDYVVVNDLLEQTVADLKCILSAEKNRTKRRVGELDAPLCATSKT